MKRQRMIGQVVQRVRKAAGRPLGTVARTLGYDVVRRDYYSPIPDLRSLPKSVWTTPSALRGVTLDLKEQLRFLEEDLRPYVEEFYTTVKPYEDGAFQFNNGTYESVDAECLYAIVRYFKPSTIVEFGSGNSTHLIWQALRTTAGSACQYQVVDPNPSPRTELLAGDRFELVKESATIVALDRFAELEAGDIVFVDTTHTVKLGSEVNYIILDVLPTLQAGVIVHFHDIFLPWPHPRRWIEQEHWYWPEQYLLQAFLAHNQEYEVIMSCHALTRSQFAPMMKDVVTSFHAGVEPGAFWIRRR